MSFISSLVALVLISSPFLPQAADAGKAAAVVAKDRVTVTIPVGRKPAWHWYVTETIPNTREYSLDIKIDGVRPFGFYLFKRPRPVSPQKGSLSDLLQVGQSNMWDPAPGGGGRVIRGISVTATSKEKNSVVEITLRDMPTVEQLLQKRPEFATIVVDIPQEPQQTYTVPITYKKK